MNATLEPISIQESERLNDLEQIVIGHRAEIVKVANALREIRDSRLYRSEFKSFGEYCKAKFGFCRQRGYQLIEFATQSVSTMVDTQPPANERQARARKQSSSRTPQPEPPAKEAEAQTSTDDDPPRIRTADQEFAEALGFDSPAAAVEAVKVSPLPIPLFEALELAKEDLATIIDADFDIDDCETLHAVAKNVRRAANELDRFVKCKCAEAA